MSNTENKGMADLRDTPMGKALESLARKMQAEGIGDIELNVIGGFAMLARGLRDKNSVTDIDFVGPDLPEKLGRLIAETGREHNMEKGWINRDAMESGCGLDSFQISTGELRFDPAFQVGPIKINALCEEDLLKLKIIAADTAMAGLEGTGSYDRAKDFPDICTLMDRQGLDANGAKTKFRDYILCPDETGGLLDRLYGEGPEGADKYVQDRQAKLFPAQPAQKQDTTGSSFLSGYMSSMLSGRPMTIEQMLRQKSNQAARKTAPGTTPGKTPVD